MNPNWQFFSVVFLLFAGLIGHPLVAAQSIDPNNIPDEIRRCVHKQPSSELDSSINPFYISGDYDGDGVTDFAVLIRSQKDRGPGIHHILFCFAHSKVVLWNSDSLSDPTSSPFTAWFLVRKQSKLLSVHPQIKHDSLAILIGDEGGGLIYWDGTKFRWQQEE